MGPQLQKQYEEMYSLSYQVYTTDRKLRRAYSEEEFEEMYSGFRRKSLKYDWAENIPVYTRKYFYDILLGVRKDETESLYKALNATLFNENVYKEEGKYERSFYINITSKKSVENARDSISILRESILFQDEVVSICNDDEQQYPVNPLFRSSILNHQNSHIRPDSNAVVMKQAIFIQNLPEKAQEQLGLYLEFYKRFSMVLESLISSASFISLPVRHFQLSMKEKKAKKKLRIVSDTEIGINRILIEETEQGEQKRRKQKFNQKLLLEQIADFIDVYTEFIWMFYNLEKINQTQYSKLVNYENIYNLITSTVWSRCQWVGDRGWEYEEYLTQLFLITNGVPKESPNIKVNIIQLACSMPTSPIKYLKQIMIKINTEMTADDLILAYNRLFYEMALRKKIRRVFRMIQIVNILWKGQKFGEVGYSWITWQACIELLFKEAKKIKLVDLEIRSGISINNNINFKKKSVSANQTESKNNNDTIKNESNFIKSQSSEV